MYSLYFHCVLLVHGERGDYMSLDINVQLEIFVTLKVSYMVALPITFSLLLKNGNKK